MCPDLLRDRARLLLFVLATIWLVPLAAEGQEGDVPADVIVNGGGRGVLSTPPPDGGAVRNYPLQFAMIAGFDGDTPKGHINFIFGRAFARDWGAVPPNDLVSVAGKITGITEDTDGFVHLTGTLTEIDVTDGEGIVFLIDDLFDVKVGGSLGPNEFVLQWCLLPEFPIRVTHGVLNVAAAGVESAGRLDTRMLPIATAARVVDAQQAALDCARGGKH